MQPVGQSLAKPKIKLILENDRGPFSEVVLEIAMRVVPKPDKRIGATPKLKENSRNEVFLFFDPTQTPPRPHSYRLQAG